MHEGGTNGGNLPHDSNEEEYTIQTSYYRDHSNKKNQHKENTQRRHEKEQQKNINPIQTRKGILSRDTENLNPKTRTTGRRS